MSVAVLIRRLREAGAPPEAIEIAVEAVEAVEQREIDRKAKRATEKRNQRMSRDNDETVARHGGDMAATVAEKAPPSPPPLPPQRDINQTPSSPPTSSSAKSREFEAEFDREFWPRWPNKVGKPSAMRAFGKARQRHALSTILAGIARYVAGKPADRPWLHPATFLNDERFNDAPAAQPRAGPSRSSTDGVTTVKNRLLAKFAGTQHGEPSDDHGLFGPADVAEPRHGDPAPRIPEQAGADAGGPLLDQRPLSARWG